MDEDHPIYKAIDSGGGQVCDIRGVIRELNAAGYVIVPREPTELMLDAGCEADSRQSSYKSIWLGMVAAAYERT